MFKHGKTGYTYYSIKDKIDYYEGIIDGRNKNVSNVAKRKALLRLRSLKKLNERIFDEPTLIVTDDKSFGNQISKPRPAVVINKDEKGRLFVAPIYKATSKQVVLDNNVGRQISKSADGKNKWLRPEDIYEIKYVSSLKSLSKNDKRKIKDLYKK